MSLPLSTVLALWASRLEFDHLPQDVVETTKLRILDVIGLALAGAETEFGCSTREAAIALSPAGPCRILGTGERVGVTAAALANGAFSQALEFDDTHNESIVHMSSPSVAAALAIAELIPTVRLKPDTTDVVSPTEVVFRTDVVSRTDVVPRTDVVFRTNVVSRTDVSRTDVSRTDVVSPVVSGFSRTINRVSGRDLIAAIAVGNEISCRVGSVAPGQFHRLGFHPSGLFAPFGVTYLAGRLLGLDADAMARAAGICGSFAAGLLECWVDGTQTKFLHPGWAAHSGIVAAFLARTGTTGPAHVFEGRFGLFASHLQDSAVPRDLSRIVDELGVRWDSSNSSFKPFPAAHVLHPYVDALLRVRKEHRIRPSDVEQIECPVAAFIVPIVCEPAAEKLAPASDSHGRVSLQYTLAEAFYFGELGKSAYRGTSLRNAEILDLARRVRYVVDPAFPGPGRFKGLVRVNLKDGRSFEAVEEYTRGSAENPMSYDELRAKFDENANGFLSASERDRLAGAVQHVEQMPDASVLVDLAIRQAQA